MATTDEEIAEGLRRSGISEEEIPAAIQGVRELAGIIAS